MHKPGDARPAAQVSGGGEFRSEPPGANGVSSGEGDVAKGASESFGVFKLGWVTEIHARGGVDAEVDVEVFFVAIGSHDWSIESREYVPIEVAEVVSVGVFAVVGEFD